MSSEARIARPKPLEVQELRSFLSRSAPAATGLPCPLGLPALDAALGGGLPTGCLQEVIGGSDGAAAGFCAFLLGRLASREGTARSVLWGWIGEGDLYPPGLAAFGLDPARVILVSAPGPADLRGGRRRRHRLSARPWPALSGSGQCGRLALAHPGAAGRALAGRARAPAWRPARRLDPGEGK